MKKILLFLSVLALLLLFNAAFAEKPVYTVQNNVLAIDFDGDGQTEYIELTKSQPTGMTGYVDLNVSRGDVLISHFQILNYIPGNETQIKLYPVRSGSENLLYIEMHAVGSENLYSMWTVAAFADNTLSFRALLYDPGWSNGVALYDGDDPVDSQKYLLYSASYDNYDQKAYLNMMAGRFAAYGFQFSMASMPFSGWYSAAVLLESSDMTCAVNVGADQLSAQRSTMGGGWEPSSGTDLTVKGNVHLRSGAGTEYVSIGVIKKGTKVNYLMESAVDYRGVAWHRVKTDKGTGWISAKYVDNALIDPLLPGTPVSTVQPTASLHVRLQPSLSAASIGTVSKGQALSFLGIIRVDDRQVSWFKVRFNGSEAWISSKYARLN